MYIFLRKRDTGELISVDPKEIGALLVGVSVYRRTEWNLRGPVHDVADMGNVLQQVYNVPPNNITNLLDAEATKINIIRASHELVNKYKYRVFQFSGHGTQIYSVDEPDYHTEVLVTHDHDWNNPLLDDDIRDVFETPEYSLMVIDACHSQGSTKGGGVCTVKSVVAPKRMKIKVNRKKAIAKMVVELAACMSHQTAFEEPCEGTWRGIFTYHLCKILREEPYIPLDVLQTRLRSLITKQLPVITPPLRTSIFKLN